MEHTLIIILGTAAIYFALFTHVAFSPKISKKLIAAAGAVAVVCGLLFYGICFSSLYDNLLLAILKTCHAVCLLFIGEGSLDAIADAPMMQYLLVQVIFSSLSFLGIFTTAGAAISAIGAGFLCRLRLYLQRSRHISVIYPLTPKTLEFARELSKETFVIFVDENPDPSCLDGAREANCLVRTDEDAISGSKAFLKSLGLQKHRRKVALYVLSDDRQANRKYAIQWAASLKALKIDSALADLTIFASEYDNPGLIRAMIGHNSFDNIMCLNHAQLAARLLMQKAPPWKAIRFDENGCATEDFRALVVGGGKVGQAVIKQLIMNSQFAGSRFSLTVFDPSFDEISGLFLHECRHIFQFYDIQIVHHDGRSQKMYQYLENQGNTLKYVVVCTGNDILNQAIAQQLSHYMAFSGKNLPVYICSRRGLHQVHSDGIIAWNIFTQQVLRHDLAMHLNHHFFANQNSPEANWANTDYFSRMCTIAAADFAPAYLHIAKSFLDTEAISSYNNAQLRENLAITEHQRWCAFMFCMGYRPMTDEEFEERCRFYLEEERRNGFAPRHILIKDQKNRIHRALVPWEKLDELSDAARYITGQTFDYKEMDESAVTTLSYVMKKLQEQTSPRQ